MNFGFFDVPRNYLANEEFALSLFSGVIVYSASHRGHCIAYLAKHKAFSEDLERYEPIIEVERISGKTWVDGYDDLRYVFKGWKRAQDQGITSTRITQI